MRNATCELLCMCLLVTLAQLQDISLLRVAYLIIKSPKLIMDDESMTEELPPYYIT